ncbi:unknown [Candidatus Apopatosoma intestinale]|nr:unknown [Candidatus Apopatosoma intestinale]
MLNLIEKLIRAGKSACIVNGVAECHRLDLGKLRLVVYACNLDILKAVVNEYRMPAFRFIALFDILVRLEAVTADKSAYCACIYLAVILQHI